MRTGGIPWGSLGTAWDKLFKVSIVFCITIILYNYCIYVYDCIWLLNVIEYFCYSCYCLLHPSLSHMVPVVVPNHTLRDLFFAWRGSYSTVAGWPSDFASAVLRGDWRKGEKVLQSARDGLLSCWPRRSLTTRSGRLWCNQRILGYCCSRYKAKYIDSVPFAGYFDPCKLACHRLPPIELSISLQKHTAAQVKDSALPMVHALRPIRTLRALLQSRGGWKQLEKDMEKGPQAQRINLVTILRISDLFLPKPIWTYLNLS
jgi:hypothetical protein